MRTISAGIWSSRVIAWNSKTPAYRMQVAKECKRDGHEWFRSPVVVFCWKCLKVDLERSEEAA